MRLIAHDTNMAQKKGLHIFRVGDLVLPHPIIFHLYRDIEDGELGIVVKTIAPNHPTKDYRKVRIFWQQQMREETYYAHLLFHLHHEDQVETLKKKWHDAVHTISFTEMKQRSQGASTYVREQILKEKLKDLIDNDRIPFENPCKGLN